MEGIMKSEKLKIGIMTAWNSDSGVSLHAQPVVREWVRMGIKVKVFSYIREDQHGLTTQEKDEPYVRRCFGTFDQTRFLDSGPILEENYDYFVVEDLGMLPQENFLRVFPEIRKKTAKLIHIYQDGEPKPPDSLFWQFQWDKVICFDQRQLNFLKNIYPGVDIVPFPCYPLRRGNQFFARIKLDLPLRKKIVLVFNQRGYNPFIPRFTDKELTGANLLFLMLPYQGDIFDFRGGARLKIRGEKALRDIKFDRYLFAADMMILDKDHERREKGIISSTAYQALGTLCPIIARDSVFFIPFKDEILKFSSEGELKAAILTVLDDKKKRKSIQRAAKKFVKERSPQIIARKLLEIFETIQGQGESLPFL